MKLIQVFFFAAIALLAVSVQAAEYSASGIAVDVTADSATVARAQALSDAAAQAFKQLRAEMAPQQAESPLPPQAALDAAVESFEVSGEKLTSNRYQASFTIHFSGAAFASLLNESAAAPTPPAAQEPVAPVGITEPAPATNPAAAPAAPASAMGTLQNPDAPSQRASGPMRVRVMFSSMEEWNVLRKKLISSGAFTRANMKSFSADYADLEVTGGLPFGEMEAALSRVGLRISVVGEQTIISRM